MRPKFGFLLLALPALLILGGCATNAPPPDDDHVECRRGGNLYSPRPGETFPIDVYVKNNGHWCGDGFFIYGGPPASIMISDQSAHGVVQVRTRKAEDSTVTAEVFYRPDPGFTGTDAFTIKTQPNNWTLNYTLHVRAGTSVVPKIATPQLMTSQ